MKVPAPPYHPSFAPSLHLHLRSAHRRGIVEDDYGAISESHGLVCMRGGDGHLLPADQLGAICQRAQHSGRRWGWCQSD
jgi:hypothetical protein